MSRKKKFVLLREFFERFVETAKTNNWPEDQVHTQAVMKSSRIAKSMRFLRGLPRRKRMRRRILIATGCFSCLLLIVYQHVPEIPIWLDRVYLSAFGVKANSSVVTLYAAITSSLLTYLLQWWEIDAEASLEREKLPPWALESALQMVVSQLHVADSVDPRRKDQNYKYWACAYDLVEKGENGTQSSFSPVSACVSLDKRFTLNKDLPYTVGILGTSLRSRTLGPVPGSCTAVFRQHLEQTEKWPRVAAEQFPNEIKSWIALPMVDHGGPTAKGYGVVLIMSSSTGCWRSPKKDGNSRAKQTVREMIVTGSAGILMNCYFLPNTIQQSSVDSAMNCYDS